MTVRIYHPELDVVSTVPSPRQAAVMAGSGWTTDIPDRFDRPDEPEPEETSEQQSEAADEPSAASESGPEPSGDTQEDDR